MEAMMKLSREVRIVLLCGVILLIVSFLDWQQFSLSFGTISGSVSFNEWHGIGVLAALLVIAMLVWEGMRLMAVNVEFGSLSPGLISVGLALFVALFTVIAFFTKDTFRQWPAWVGLIMALVLGATAVMRAKADGVQMPETKTPSS